MSLDNYDDTEADDHVADQVGRSSKVEYVLRKVFGDPRSAPSRIAKVVLFVFITVVTYGVWTVATQNVSSSGSSYWFFKTLVGILKSWWLPPVVSVVLYHRYIGLRRSWAARQAANMTGWLTTSVKQLSDEMRSSDHMHPVIVTSEMAQSEIADYLDKALDGQSHDAEGIDYRSVSEAGDGEADPAALPDSDFSEGAFTAAATGAERLADRLEDAEPSFQGTEHSPETAEADDDSSEEATENVPWKVALAEELKQFTLHLSAAFESGALMWRLGLPYAIAVGLQFVYTGIWIGPATAAVILFGTGPLLALGTFYTLSRLRSRRIKRHREPSAAEYWDAQMALVKTVETPDVTCYMGRAAGRSYASYDREEFIDEFSQRLWEMTTQGEEVSPSVMEQYARNLKQMKPNLPGHLENIEIPSINREISKTVKGSPDEIVTKSKLAYEVITNASDTKFGRNLGHDPALVRERYRAMVEDEHSLAETTLMTETASGEEVELTLVYPASKRRLPEMSQMQSRFSERFMGAHGEPIFQLPEVDPTEDLRGVNVPRDAYEMMPDRPELPSAPGSTPSTTAD
ncbi:hypothetical protein G9464_20875 [Halostella sp. JP-L12]|uniref:hypothetical protein n=1 Tax=Halostella TaxID=1843185 RepID=UPI000EF7F244|nr:MULTISPECIES: hypothetical protein [Halostella]NHN50026.1 hypothetical protein [Halostella sp. JP-L12]